MKKNTSIADRIAQAVKAREEMKAGARKRIETYKLQEKKEEERMSAALSSDDLEKYTDAKIRSSAAKDMVEMHQKTLRELDEKPLFDDYKSIGNEIRKEQERISTEAMEQITPLADRANEIVNRALSEIAELNECLNLVNKGTEIKTSTATVPPQLIGFARVIAGYTSQRNGSH